MQNFIINFINLTQKVCVKYIDVNIPLQSYKVKKISILSDYFWIKSSSCAFSSYFMDCIYYKYFTSKLIIVQASICYDKISNTHFMTYRYFSMYISTFNFTWLCTVSAVSFLNFIRTFQSARSARVIYCWALYFKWYN